MDGDGLWRATAIRVLVIVARDAAGRWIATVAGAVVGLGLLLFEMLGGHIELVYCWSAYDDGTTDVLLEPWFRPWLDWTGDLLAKTDDRRHGRRIPLEIVKQCSRCWSSGIAIFIILYGVHGGARWMTTFFRG